MSDRIIADVARIQAGSTDIRSCASRLDSEVSLMMNHLTGLQDAWHGSASASFQQLLARWQNTQSQVRSSLEEIHGALSRAGIQYAEVEAANTALFRG